MQKNTVKTPYKKGVFTVFLETNRRAKIGN